MRKHLAGSDFHIYIIEQEQGKPFNRGKLANVGFKLLPIDFTHFCIHDVDMLPIDADYLLTDDINHMATQVEQFNYKMPYPDYFGGVTVFPVDTYAIINGFNNEFWGWGAEDDDLLDRVKSEGYQVVRYNNQFKSLKHKHALETEDNRKLHRKNSQKLIAHRALKRYDDGLQNCEFTVNHTTQIEPNVTLINVSI